MTLTEKIISLVPDIVELKFGCRVEYGNKQYTYCGVGKPPIVFFRESYLGLDVVVPLTEYKILGRPITLADVLRAIDKGVPNGVHLKFGAHGLNRIYFNNTPVQDDPYWNLSADLDGQSEPTKAFLRTLLGANEG